MITGFSSDVVSSIATELPEYLDNQVSTIAPHPTESWDFIHVEFQKYAQSVASDINQTVRSQLEQALEQGRRLTEAKEKLTRRGEFSRFKEKLQINSIDARKVMRLFERFNGWSIEKLLVIASSVNIFTLCQAKFDEVVQDLRLEATITKEFVKRLVKEVRDAAKQDRKKQSGPVSGWKQDVSGGGRHYEVVLYDEQTGMKIEQLATEQGVLPQRVIADAIAAYSQPVVQPDAQVLAQIEELQSVTADMRELLQENRKLQLELSKRDEKIAELENCLALALSPDFDSSTIPEVPHEAPSPESIVPPPDVLANQILDCQSWTEAMELIDGVAAAIGEDRSIVFVSVAKYINIERRQHLVRLLANHIRQFPLLSLGSYSWLPESLHKLRDKAIALAHNGNNIR